MSSLSKAYDVAIIGAGIGGLTAGCYLAKSGLSVAIVERHSKVGGYCGSFPKEGFIFDEAVHYVNHMSQSGILRKILEELGIYNSIKIVTIDPSDILCMPDFEIRIYHDTIKTVEELARLFPSEKESIEKFFEIIINFNFSKLSEKYRGHSFQDILDALFVSSKLKTSLAIFATILGLPPKDLSGLAALAYYKGSILDGGHHPIGGAQAFSNVFSDHFVKCGGTIFLNKKVEKILVENKYVKGILLDNGQIIRSKYIIANCDASQLYSQLIDKPVLERGFVKKIESLIPSASNFIVYLGLNKSLRDVVPVCSNLWRFPYYSFDEGSVDITKDSREDGFVHVALSSLHDRNMAPEGCESIILFAAATLQNEEYWKKNKERFMDVMIKRAEKLIPGLSKCIKIKLPATPLTLYRYTLNRAGAYRGWEITPNQTKATLVNQHAPIENLYLAGHWITTPVGNGGVSMVANSGKMAAKAIIRDYENAIMRQND